MTIKLQSFVVTLMAERRGQDLVEYALLAGFAATCAAFCFPAVLATGSRLDAVIQQLLQEIIRLQ